MTSKKQLRADLQALQQDIEAARVEIEILSLQVLAERKKRAQEIARKDFVIRTLSGLIHYQGDGAADEAMAIVRGES